MAMEYSILPTNLIRSSQWRNVSNTAAGLYLFLWCTAAELDQRGLFIDKGRAMTDDDLAWATHRTTDEAFTADLSQLVEAGLITATDDSVWMLPDFQVANPKTQEERREEWRAKKSGGSRKIKESFSEDSPENPKGNSEITSSVGVDVDVDVDVDKSIGSSSELTPPPDSPPVKQKKGKKSTADPRSAHQAIVLVHQITGKMPNKDIYDPLITSLGESPNGELLRNCWQAWRARGYSPNNFAWALEWYTQGGPAKYQQPAGQQRPQTGKTFTRPQVSYTDDQRKSAAEKAKAQLAALQARREQQNAAAAH